MRKEFRDSLTVSEAEELATSVIDSNKLLYYWARGLLQEPQDEFSVDIARTAFPNLISEMREYGMSERELLREIASNQLENLREAVRAGRPSSYTISGAQLLSEQDKEILAQIHELPLSAAKVLLAAAPEAEKLVEKMMQAGNPMLLAPFESPKPRRDGGTVDEWLSWYHGMRRRGMNCTLYEVANRSGFNYGYIKQRNMIFWAKPNQEPNRNLTS
jgi:hypothetical protein